MLRLGMGRETGGVVVVIVGVGELTRPLAGNGTRAAATLVVTCRQASRRPLEGRVRASPREGIWSPELGLV